MQCSYMLSALLAEIQWYETVGFKWLVVLAVIAACYSLGLALGRALRMPEYGWKIGVILTCLGVAPVVIWARWPPNLGVDLNGGMILIYQIKEGEKISTGTGDDGTEEEPASRRGRRGAANASGGSATLANLVDQLKRRINPGGTLEIKVRQYGDRGIEIIIPETDPEEVARIKRLIEKAGVLEFLIVADRVRDQDLIDLANTDSEKEQELVIRNRGKASAEPVGRWVKIGREQDAVAGVHPLKVHAIGHEVRDSRTKERLVVPPDVSAQQDEKGVKFAQWLEKKDIKEVEILMVVNTSQRVSGKDLGQVSVDSDEEAKPCVSFNMTTAGGTLMARLTSANSPDPTTGHYRLLGIVLDDELLSAPRIQSVISDRGRITGKFSMQEVNELIGILRSGSLSAVLDKNPISENPIGPELGRDTIRKGEISSAIALVAVLVFMIAYYRFSGVVAVATLGVNLFMMLAIMVLFHATFTLSGIAGIVLTMGMAVDANVLIFERIREELARGAALRMALRNGFSRATTTIIDSNLTTLITAVALYVIGTDQIRGFAVTLILGIVLSMFAAIFCARVVFDIGERKRWITRLTMIKLLTETRINFMGLWQVTTAVSVVLIAAGLVGAFFRGSEMMGIDFTGGTAVHLMLKERMPVDQVRAKLNEAFLKAGKEKGTTLQFNLVNVPVEGKAPETVFKVDSTIEDVDKLKEIIAAEFKTAAGESLLFQNVLTVDEASIKSIVPEALGAAEDDPLGKSPGKKPAGGPGSATDESDHPPDSKPAKNVPEKKEPEPQSPEKEESDAKKPDAKEPDKQAPDATEPSAKDADKKDPADLPCGAEPAQRGQAGASPLLVAQADDSDPPPTDVPKDPDNAPADKDDPGRDGPLGSKTGGELPPRREASSAKTKTEVVLNFKEPIGQTTLRDEIVLVAKAQDISLSKDDVLLRTADLTEGAKEIGASTKRKAWLLTITADEAQTRKIVAQLETDVAKSVHWPSWNKIGVTIAGKMQRVAFFSMVVSCLGIVAYVWFRFEKLMYGLAAIIATIHDVFCMLAAIALSHWLYGVLGFVGIEDFKINMIEVAAFLTIIGYSLNDTIVVFDRIREVKGKSPNIDGEMVNRSINQTLSRTILTSLTTLIVIVILYIFGGQSVHGFAFALLVGVVTGTYSSIFIAAPLLLWMSRFGKTAQIRTKAAA